MDHTNLSGKPVEARPIPFENPMLLIEETKLNNVGLVFVKARGGRTPIPVQEGEHDDSLREIIHVDGPSFFFTWWPGYGATPHPGDWIEISARVLDGDELNTLNLN